MRMHQRLIRYGSGIGNYPADIFWFICGILLAARELQLSLRERIRSSIETGTAYKSRLTEWWNDA